MEDYRIIRTSWLYGPFGRNMVDSFLDRQNEKRVIIPHDYYGSPTFTIDLALGTTGIILANPGIYHLTNEGVCSLYQLAREIIPHVIHGEAEERKARRPHNVVLMNKKTDPLRPWREALSAYCGARGAERQFHAR